MTVLPVSSRALALSNVVNNVAYYPGYNPSGTPATSSFADDAASPPSYFLDSEDPAVPPELDLSNGQAAQGTGGHRAAPNDLIFFSVTSDSNGVAAPGGGYVVIFVTAQGNSGEKVIPIAFAGDALANGALCPSVSGCLSLNAVGGFNYYFSFNYTPGTTITVGLYPGDICYIYNAFYGGTAYGCNGTPSAVTVNNTTGGSQMQLKFYMTTIANDGTNGGTTALNAMVTSPADSVTTSIGLIFENLTATPSLTCPPTYADLYVPGDGQLVMDTTMFSGRVSGTVAPSSAVIVVGNDGSAPVVSKAYRTENSVVSRVGIGAGQAVTGLTNTTNGNDHWYQLAFFVRDAAGIVATGGTQSCTLTNVQASPIQGFLGKNSCFIATAAYGSADAAPVVMLRRFRDVILLKSETGRAFVRWYYDWSPPAAEWLVRHPVFRFPVLVALVPIEALAWLLLHPRWILLPLTLMIFAVWVAFRKASARVSNES